MTSFSWTIEWALIIGCLEHRLMMNFILMIGIGTNENLLFVFSIYIYVYIGFRHKEKWNWCLVLCKYWIIIYIPFSIAILFGHLFKLFRISQPKFIKWKFMNLKWHFEDNKIALKKTRREIIIIVQSQPEGDRINWILFKLFNCDFFSFVKHSLSLSDIFFASSSFCRHSFEKLISEICVKWTFFTLCRAFMELSGFINADIIFKYRWTQRWCKWHSPEMLN